MSVVRKGPRAAVARVCAYVVLAGVAVLALFPFLVGLSIAFKEPQDAFNYPPTLIPRTPATGVVDGEARQLFTIPGEEGSWALMQTGVSVLELVDPADPSVVYEVPADQVERTGLEVTVDGQSRSVVVATIDGARRELARIRSKTAGLFQRVDDPTQQKTANVRDLTPVREFGPRPANFQDVLERQNLNRSLTNTFLVTVLVVVGQVLTSIMGGYAFARMRFRGRDALFLGYLGSVMIPFVVLIIPLYQLMVQLGWVDNLVALVVPFIFTAYGTFLMRQFFIGIPPEIEEAALLDGASRWRILWRIFVPLARPAIATLATFAFLYAWNSFVWPLVIINSGSQDNFVLSIALQQLGGRSQSDINLVFAGIVIAMLPPVTVYLLAQRQYVENAAGSGLK